MVTPDTAGNAASVCFSGRYPDPKRCKAKMRINSKLAPGAVSQNASGLQQELIRVRLIQSHATKHTGRHCISLEPAVRVCEEKNCVTSNDLFLLVKVSGTC